MTRRNLLAATATLAATLALATPALAQGRGEIVMGPWGGGTSAPWRTGVGEPFTARTGMPVRISLDAFPGRTFAGRVSRIAPFVRELEKQARTVDVEVKFERVPQDLMLLSGYSADVEILLDQRQTLRVPTESLLEGGRVLRYDPGSGHLREQRVELGLSNWRWSEVRGGLAAGDRILPSLQHEGLADGSVVSPRRAPEGRP